MPVAAAAVGALMIGRSLDAPRSQFFAHKNTFCAAPNLKLVAGVCEGLAVSDSGVVTGQAAFFYNGGARP